MEWRGKKGSNKALGKMDCIRLEMLLLRPLVLLVLLGRSLPHAAHPSFPPFPPLHATAVVTMGNVWAKKPLKEIMRENKRMITRAIRELDRERMNLERNEKKLIMDIKKYAKENQMGAVKTMAKDLVRTRYVGCRGGGGKGGRAVFLPYCRNGRDYVLILSLACHLRKVCRLTL